MQTYAITPHSVGQPVSSRAIKPDWPLSEGETFKVTLEQPDNPGNYVLDATGTALRAVNDADRLATARAEKLASLKALRDAIEFDAFPFEFAGKTHWIQSDPTSLMRIDAIQIAIISGDLSVFPVMWRTAANEWISLSDAPMYSDLMEGRRDHPVKTWQAYTLHEQALKAHADPASYDIAGGNWPVTRIDRSAY